MAGRARVSSAEVELLEASVWAELHGRFGLEAGNEFAIVKRWGRAAALASRAANAVAINRAIGFGFERPLDRRQLSEIRTFFRDQGKSRWFVECSPDASIDVAALVAAGGVVGGSVIKLVADLDDQVDLPAPAFDVISASAADGARFMDLVGTQLAVPEAVRYGIVSTIGDPEWHFYFAMASGQPVAGAAMFIDGESAWLGLAGTVPECRNRGAQTALLVRRLRDAKAAGCRWVSADAIAESGPPNSSWRNMKRLGFGELYQRPWYRFQENAARPAACDAS